MLIAPRISNNTNGAVPGMASQARYRDREFDDADWTRNQIRATNPREVVSPDMPTWPHARSRMGDKDSSSRSWELQNSGVYVETPRRRDLSDPATKDHNVSQHQFYGNQSSSETLPHDTYQPKIPTGWHDAIDGLNSLRQNLSPLPLRVVKHSVSNPNHQNQDPNMKPRRPFRTDTTSFGRFESPTDTRQIQSESNRGLNLSKSEGDLDSARGLYTPSLYSHDSDAEPRQSHNHPETRT